jgi:hypothetical protein
MAGKSIKLHIADQDKRHIKTAELGNWTGKAFIGKRKHVKILQSFEELTSPGIYFLISQNNETNQKELYIGEAENVSNRMNQHLKGKDWWDDFVIFISKDTTLTKSHVKYLEKKFIQIAKKNNTVFSIKNANESFKVTLSDSDMDDMETFLENMIFVMQNLNLLDFVQTQEDESKETKQTLTEIFYLNLTSDRIDQSQNILKAKLIITENGYRLLKDSYIETIERKSFPQTTYYTLRKKLENQQVFVKCPFEGVYQLNQDIDFNSSSAAAAIVKNRSVNGPKEWKTSSGMTLDEWENK